MNLHWIDWTILGVIMGFVTLMAIGTRHYTRSVADFLAASRCAGRYLLTMAEGAAGLGAISIVAFFEQYYQAGFPAAWWTNMMAPLLLIMALSGWVAYRFRETRALTIAQFFEMRYSRRFRVFSGILAWLAGVLNYGIFPAVTARFIIWFFGIPVHIVQVSGLSLNLTMAAVMFVMLSIALAYTFMGGHIAVMVTDFVQSSLFNIVFVTIILLLLVQFGWGHIIETLKTAPEGQSMLNPFKQANVPDFNAWFFVMQAFVLVYTYRVWPGSQGYRSSAKSPHETKMAAILGGWRMQVAILLYMIVPICAYVLMHSPASAGAAQSVRQALDCIGDTQIQKQMTVPLALTKMLPVGVFGLMCAVIVAAAVSTDDTYLHSWGSIFIQDVVLPLRGKPLAPRQHIQWLRRSIFGVAAFAFLFSMLFPLKEYILMFFTITGAIYLGGAGSAMIGGLYWKRGTTAGAWAGMSIGSVLAVGGIVIRNILWPLLPGLCDTHPGWGWMQALPETFPLNGMQMSFCASVIAIGAYAVVSLLTKPDPDFDMDQMLHRGKYSLEGEHKRYQSKGIWKRLGMGDEFTPGDKVIYLFQIAWILFFFAAFVIGTVYNLSHDVSDESWAKWWLFQVVLMIVMAVGTTIWFLIGGVRDLFDMYRTLRTAKRNAADDGTVSGHHLAADEVESDLDSFEERIEK